jgi:Domain of unknown function (DUF4157)
MHTTTEPQPKSSAKQPDTFFGGGAMPFFQAKLTVNQPGDAFEQEADRVADQVVGGQQVRISRGTAATPIQSKCSECEQHEVEHEKEEPVQRKCDCEHEQPEENPNANEETGRVQMKCAACAEKEMEVSRKSNGETGGNLATDSVTQVLNNGGQETLPQATQNLMSQRMGYDFSQVRIQTGSNAAESAQSIQARAYTHGNQIVFGANQYQPGTEQGDRLIAHELTHVVQQSSNIQRSSFWDTIAQSTDVCNPKKKEETSTPEESSEEKTGNNFTPGMGLCELTPDQPETPPEGTPEPTEGDATQVGVEEKGDVASRQQLAPNPSKDAPAGDNNLGENIENNTSIKDMLCPPEAKAAGENSPAKRKSRPAPKAPQPKVEAQPAETDLAAPNATPDGASQTEHSDKADKDKNGKLLETDKKLEANEQVNEALNAVTTNASFGVQFDPATINREDEESVRQSEEYMAQNTIMANHFLGYITAQSAGIASNYFQIQNNIDQELTVLTTQLQADIDIEVENTSLYFKDLKAEAKKSIRREIQAIKNKQKTAIEALSASKTTALSELSKSLVAEVKNLGDASQTTLNTLSTNYSNGVSDIQASGTHFAEQSVSRAETHASAYSVAKNGTAHQQYLVINEESDGFWDGKLTYKRFMARRDAARNVGKQFGEGFVDQSREIALQLLCGKAKDQEIIAETTRSGYEAQSCLYDKAVKNINSEFTAESLKVNTAAEETILKLQQVLQVSLVELAAEEQKQIEQLKLFGSSKIQTMKDGANSQKDLLASDTANALAAFNDTIHQFRNFVWTNGLVDPVVFVEQANWFRLLFNVDLISKQAQQNLAGPQIIAGLNDQKTQAGLQAMLMHLIGGLSASQKWALVEESVKDTAKIVRQELSNLQKKGDATIKEAGVKGTNDLKAVVTGINTLYGKITSGVSTTFSDTNRDIRAGFQKTLNNDLDSKICKEAEAAAKKVKPRWKKILAVLLVVLVVVIVLVVAPGLIAAIGSAAASLAGSLGAATALATSIGAWVGPIVGGAILGALSQVTIQVGNNALDSVKLTTGLKEAAITGAIGGALGGLGGQVASVWAGRATTAGMQMARQFGTEAVFDLGGSILGELAVGNELSLTNLAIGMAIGGAIQGGVKVGGTVGNKVKVAAPDSAAGKLVSNFEKFQLRSVEFGEKMGSKLAFGKPKTDVIPGSTTIADDAAPDTTPVRNDQAPDEQPLTANQPPSTKSGNGDISPSLGQKPKKELPITSKDLDDSMSDGALKTDTTDGLDHPDVSHEQKGDFSTSAEDGHHVSEGPLGPIRCSPSCTYMKDRYRVELRNPKNAHLKAEFDKISAMPRGKAKTEAAAKLSKKLDKVVESGEVSHKRWDDPKLTKEEFYDDYVTKFPDTTLTKKEILAYFKAGYRLNPQTGKFKNPNTGAEADFNADIVFKETFDPLSLKSKDVTHLKKLVNDRKKLISERDKKRSDAAYNAKNKEVIDATESIGNTAADIYMVGHLDYKLEYTGVGNYTLDKVYFKDGVYYVIEVKGGSSTLGTKLGESGKLQGNLDGKVLQQGTPEYLKQTIAEMKVSQDIATVKMGQKLEAALKAGKIKYGLIQQKLDGGGNLVDTSISDFQL